MLYYIPTSHRQDEERLERKRRGELLDLEEEAVITALDMEDAWRKQVPTTAFF